jgi:hypothetical protein
MDARVKRYLPWALAGALAFSCFVLVPVAVGIGWLMGKPPAGSIIIPRPLPEVAAPAPQAEEPKDKRDLAKVQATETLTVACQAYCLRHGEYPIGLKQLLLKDARNGPYLDDPSALVDPWGQQFQYDRDGPRNNGRKPDIWTKSPDGIVIGNWAP